MRREGVPKLTKYLLIGSTKAYSGKSAIALGMALALREQGLAVAYGKPLGTCFSSEGTRAQEEDVRFAVETLKLSESQIPSTLVFLDEKTVYKRLRKEDNTDYRHSLAQYLQAPSGDLVLLEGPANLEEGSLFDLSLTQIAETVDASVLLVVRPIDLYIDDLLSAKRRLGSRLVGVVLNDVPSDKLESLTATVRPFLEASGIPVLGMLPRSALLRSVSVKELVHQLKAEVLCRQDRLDLMVETLTIGAMNVSSAMKYFRKARNMAVVTGGDRTDIQLAALESSTQCLILTGHLPPSPLVIGRAEEMEIPVLSVDLDTLTTVEIIDSTFGSVRLHERIKVECVTQLMAEHFDLKGMMASLGMGDRVD
ncbi:phosphotransacetylase family protein [Microcoleus sp. herbarium12]|uniref:phosphotransacetylase family protein n=1 Tax=Microcoleus sp. herbarium12 TaxID=3055437 RepID=UPI002FD4AF10